MADIPTVTLAKVPVLPTAAYVSSLDFRTVLAEGKPRVIVTAHLTEVNVVDNLGVKTWSTGGRTEVIHQDSANPDPRIAASMATVMTLYGQMVVEIAKMNAILKLV